VPTAIESLRRVVADAAPAREIVLTGGGMEGLFFEGEPLGGRPTRVFAYLGRPAITEAPRPAVVLVHGGGGRAYAEWATRWVQRGYIALAVDLSGAGPDGLPDDHAGPLPDDAGKYGSLASGVENTWMFHSVSAVLRAVSILLDDPEVDRERVFLNGISWGSHVAQLAMSIDPRVRRATFVYGAGFLADKPLVGAALADLPPDLAAQWLAEFDQSNHLHRIAAPTLWVTGANDNCYPLDTFVRSAGLVSGPTVLRTTPGLEHSHLHGWSPIEPFEFFEEVAGCALLPRLGVATATAGTLSAPLNAELPVVAAQLHRTTDPGEWVDRAWVSTPAVVVGDTVSAPLPEPSGTVMLSVTDIRGATTSTTPLSL
jgi:dienelactone hydrolase